MRKTAPDAMFSPKPPAGFFATLSSLLGAKGSGARSGPRPHIRRTSLIAILLLCAMALPASSALALNTHLYSGTSFGPDGTGGTASFQSLQAVSVDQASGDIYVFDSGAPGGKLYKFNAAGEPVNFSALSGNAIENVGGSEGAENEIAIAPPGSPGGTAGDIYLANNTSGAFQVYAASGERLGEVETFGETCGIAVDPAGHVFAGIFGSNVAEYTPTTNPPTAADLSAVGTAEVGLCNVAADGLGNIYASSFFGGSTAKLEGIADASPTLIEPGGATLAVDPTTNDLYLDRGSSIAVFSSAGEPKGQFGANGLSESHGVAIGATAEKVYVANGIAGGKVDIYGPKIILPDVTTEAASEIGSEGATLNGTISAAGGPEASCEFQLTTEDAFNKEGFTGAESVPCTPAGPFIGSGIEAISAEVSGLDGGTTYFFRVVGTNENGSNPSTPKGGALSFRTAGPRITASTVTEITSSSALVTGLIETNGEATTYHVEYGPTESYGSSAPASDVPALLPEATGNFSEFSFTIKNVKVTQGTFAVGQGIVGEGIQPGTKITKIEGSLVTGATLTLSKFTVFGGEGTPLTSTTAAVSQRLSGLDPATSYHFRIVASGGATANGPDGTFTTFAATSSLPDGRAYELVSPAQKIGEVIPPEPSNTLGGSCIECLPGINTITMPAQARPDGGALAFMGQPFSSGLAAGVNDYVSGRSQSGWSTASITSPLLAANDEAGFKGLSSDLNRGVLLQSAPALSPEVPVGEEGNSFKDLYLWEAGNPDLRPLVTVKPPNRSPFNPAQGVENPNTLELDFAAGNSGSAGAPAFEHLVFEANDALTDEVPGVAPEAPEAEAGRCGGFPASACDLYEWVGGQLRLINVLPGNTTAAPRAVIGSGRRLAEGPSSDPGLLNEQAADVDHAISADGRRIFWSDESGQLYVRIDGKETVKIEDSGQFLSASADGSKVLLSDGCLYDLGTASCEAHLSGSPEGFLGIMGASEDLSRVYFVSTEALAEGASAGLCQISTGGTGRQEELEGKVPAGSGCNLYAYDNGEVSLIATINESDNNIGSGGADYGSWRASRSNRTAQVSPDGRYLAFMSYASLGGHDNRVVSGAEKCKQSASFSPNCFEVYEYDLGAKSLACPSCNPSGQRPIGKANLSLIRPALGGVQQGAPFRQPENLLGEGEGRLFFESQDTLSPKDTNGSIQDVYEWTPNGVGDCAHTQGCVALISSGHAANDSMFVDSTPSGGDAFFITRERLLPQDKDQLLDVYDARVGGGIETDVLAPCEGEGCKAPIAPAPQPPSSGSSQFEGPGNAKPSCRRGFVRKHGKCVKRRHHKKKAHHKKRTASHKRGGAK